VSVRRLLVAIGTGTALAVLVVAVCTLAAVMLAVSGERTVSIPFMVTAASGSGADILALTFNPLGVLVWLVVLTALFALPVAVVRRRQPDRA